MITVQVKRADGQVRIFPVEIVAECYLQGDSWHPGIGFSTQTYQDLEDFTGDDGAGETVLYWYAEGSDVEGTLGLPDKRISAKYLDHLPAADGSWSHGPWSFRLLLNDKPATWDEIDAECRRRA